MAPKIVTVGWISMDIIKTPGKSYKSPGAAGLYSSLASAKFSSTGLVARVGNDFPEEILQKIKKAGLDTLGIKRVPGISTNFVVEYDKKWRADYTHAEAGVGAALSTEDFPEEYLGASILYISPMDPRVQEQWVGFGKGKIKTIALGTNQVHTKIPELREVTLQMLSNVDVFICNEEEAFDLFETKNLESATNRMGEMVELGIVTLDKDGAILIKDRVSKKYFSVPATVADPCGAGDVLIGSFLGNLVQYGSVDKALLSAIDIAAVNVASPGVSAFLDAVDFVR